MQSSYAPLFLECIAMSLLISVICLWWNWEGSGYAHQVEYQVCLLLRLKSFLSSFHGMVRSEPCCRRICEHTREEIMQCQVSDHRLECFCRCCQADQNGRESVCVLQASLAQDTLDFNELQPNILDLLL